jgi:hypothetical protein
MNAAAIIGLISTTIQGAKALGLPVGDGQIRRAFFKASLDAIQGKPVDVILADVEACFVPPTATS